MPSLLLLPIQFPDYNNIDSIDSENVIRFGLRNTLQTKRDGQLDNLLDWNVMLDWRLKPNTSTNALQNGLTTLGPQKTFNDLYSDLAFRPRSWLTLESQLRYDINDGYLNLAFHQLTFTPNERWSWGLGHWYLRGGLLGNDAGGDNFITSTCFYRLNDNWGLRAAARFQRRGRPVAGTILHPLPRFAELDGRADLPRDGQRHRPGGFHRRLQLLAQGQAQAPLGGDAVSPYHLVGE